MTNPALPFLAHCIRFCLYWRLFVLNTEDLNNLRLCFVCFRDYWPLRGRDSRISTLKVPARWQLTSWCQLFAPLKLSYVNLRNMSSLVCQTAQPSSGEGRTHTNTGRNKSVCTREILNFVLSFVSRCHLGTSRKTVQIEIRYTYEYLVCHNCAIFIISYHWLLVSVTMDHHQANVMT